MTATQLPPASPLARAGEFATMVGDVTPFEPAAVRTGARAMIPTLEELMGSEAGVLRGPKMPVKTNMMRRLYNEGKELGGLEWYHQFGPTIRRIHGPEADAYAGVVASLVRTRRSVARIP